MGILLHIIFPKKIKVNRFLKFDLFFTFEIMLVKLNYEEN